MIELDLPIPPSLNHYYKRVGKRTIISEAGRRYRERVRDIVKVLGLAPMSGPLALEIELFPPTDNRERDLDNFDSKALFDALQHAGLFKKNDSQIKKRSSEWGKPITGGAIIVRVGPHAA